MKFGHLFEFHKIPEWYTEYVHYKDLREQIDKFKAFCKDGLAKPLNGYYMINPKG
jgi:SPX domain protein involved in polyphosphate accumulation